MRFVTYAHDDTGISMSFVTDLEDWSRIIDGAGYSDAHRYELEGQLERDGYVFTGERAATAQEVAYVS